MTVATTQKAQSNSGSAIHEPKASRILGLDYGQKRIGLALSDEVGLTATPLTTITRTNRRDDIRRLRQICQTHKVARIVVGHPLHITGEISAMAQEAEKFAARIRKALGIQVELQDERLTTWEAEEMSKSARKRKRAPLDDVAAAILLRDYLEHHAHSALPTEKD